MKKWWEKYDWTVWRLVTEGIFWILVTVALYFLMRWELWLFFAR